jgi:glycosyltransferase involved in cell wall biosynthesis
VLALGLGVPVIGTEVDGLAETLGEQRGILVPPDDPVALSRAIAGILRGDLTVRQRAARRYAQQFTAGRVSDFYYTEYQALLQRGGPRDGS